jgi:hypothetical protein
MCNEACPTQRRVCLHQILQKIKLLAITTHDSDEDHKQKKRDNVDHNPIFAASYSSSEPRLLTPGNLNNQDLNFPE